MSASAHGVLVGELAVGVALDLGQRALEDRGGGTRPRAGSQVVSVYMYLSTSEAAGSGEPARAGAARALRSVTLLFERPRAVPASDAGLEELLGEGVDRVDGASRRPPRPWCGTRCAGR